MTSVSDKNGRTFFKSHESEFVKQKIVLDGQGRPSEVYTVNRYAKANDPCDVTKYLYEGINSTTIVGRSESESIWLEAYETALASIL